LNPQELYSERAAIYAEFGRILVIGIGYFTIQNSELVFRCKALKSEDEVDLLLQFSQLIDQLTAKEPWKLCAHNGKEFDFPYLCRRLLINQLPLPKLLRIMGKKPWETPHLLDTMEMWKFGDVKAYTSLDLLAACFGIQSSKDDIDGSQVGKIYFESGDLNRIAKYCMKDVAVMAQVFMRLMGLESIDPKKINFQE
jgi:DNA polymerase elongation subunit (family B)